MGILHPSQKKILILQHFKNILKWRDHPAAHLVNSVLDAS